jgi:hypothetical protein
MEVVTCSMPADTTGYAQIDEVNLDLSFGQFEVHAQCAIGYEGLATAQTCTSSGDYTLVGCTEIVLCTSPNNTLGYVVTNEADLHGASAPLSASITLVTQPQNDPFEPRLSAGTSLSVSAMCAAGYDGAATAIVRSNSHEHTQSHNQLLR